MNVNSNCNVANLDQYFSYIDFLEKKRLLTNAISAQVKSDLRNLRFKDLEYLDLSNFQEQTKDNRIQTSQLSPKNFTSKNFIKNGQFTQWSNGDRVEYQGGSTVYSADHWFGRRGRYANNLIASRVNSSEDKNSAMQLLRVEGDEEIYEIAVAQLIDTTETSDLVGKTVMLAAKVRCGSGYSVKSNQLTVAVFCSNHSKRHKLNPFTLGKDSQVIATTNVNLTQKWSKCFIYGEIPAPTQKIMVTFRTGEMISTQARDHDYFEITDVELKTL